MLFKAYLQHLSWITFNSYNKNTIDNLQQALIRSFTEAQNIKEDYKAYSSEWNNEEITKEMNTLEEIIKTAPERREASNTQSATDGGRANSGSTLFHNLQFSALVPLVEHYKDKEDGISTTIKKAALAKIVVGTLWYPVEVFRTFRRMGMEDSLRKFIFDTPIRVHWQGYSMFLIRTVPQTAIALGGAIWLTDK